MNQGDFAVHGGTPSVVIDNFNAGGMAINPHKANPPLGVDADAVLAFAVTFEGFELVTRGHPQKLNDRGRVDLLQFAQRHGFKVGKPRNPFAGKQGLRIAAMKALDHARMITASVINCQIVKTALAASKKPSDLYDRSYVKEKRSVFEEVFKAPGGSPEVTENRLRQA